MLHHGREEDPVADGVVVDREPVFPILALAVQNALSRLSRMDMNLCLSAYEHVHLCLQDIEINF